jgi:DnaJ-class molecular chaperone
MPQIHSHYENLKVARSAPPEVIRAAYKALARIHHPDVNPSPDSARIMALVNVAFDVLSDPQKKAAHDKWIIDQEQQLPSKRFPSSNLPVGKHQFT